MLTALGLGAIVALVLANGYFVAAEFAYVAAKRAKLEDKASTGDRKAKRAIQVHQRLSFMLSGAQLGITVTSLVVGFIAEPVLGRALKPVVRAVGVPESSSKGIALLIGFVLATVAQMVFGELAPKNLAIARPEPVARAVAHSTWWFMRLAGPVIRLFDGAANKLLRSLGVEPVEELHGGVSVEELDLIVEESAERGNLTDQQANLLTRAIEFANLRASSAMIPWNRVSSLPATTSCEQLRSLIADSYSRFPVMSLDNRVLGIVHVKDLLKIEDSRLATTTVGAICRPGMVVPESTNLRTVLDGLRQETTEMAIVADEYGAPAGVVTLEDLVEELVGEIGDEYDDDDDQPSITADPVAGWRVPGRMRVDEVERATEIDLPDEDGFDTIAGLFLDRIQRIPVVGDRIEINDVVVTVTAMEHWAITELRIEEQAKPNDDEDDS